MLWLLFPFDCLFYDCLFYQQSSFNSMGERGHFFFALAWPTYPLIVHITKLSPINQNDNFSLTMTMLPSLIADWGVKSLLTKIGATITYVLVVTWYLTVSNAVYWYIGTFEFRTPIIPSKLMYLLVDHQPEVSNWPMTLISRFSFNALCLNIWMNTDRLN